MTDIFALALYIAPLLIAAYRGHKSVYAIAFVDILLGWTIVGWLVAMIWSLTGNVKPAPA
jgi:hypothetical protein